MEHIDKRGYLNTDYLLFHINDQSKDEHSFHYHEFDKIVVLLSGKASYIIEGREYFLEPGDVLFVNHHDIHKPVIDPDEPYNRIVLWINRDFLTTHSTDGCDLSLCFTMCSDAKCLFRPAEDDRAHCLKLLLELEEECRSHLYGAKAASDAALIKYLIALDRAMIASDGGTEIPFRCDRKIADILEYINSNLQADLSCDTLAARFFLSRSYLMHRFRSETGYTLHSYVLQKRLFYSRKLLEEGRSINEAALSSGFADYTTYLRAFKKVFNCLPSDFNDK